MIKIYTDGACSGNPGPGGWGCVIALPEGQVKELGGGQPATTNNRMEMTAAIEALLFVAARSEPVLIHSDSTYVIQGITSWIVGWKARGWKTAAGAAVKNVDLWRALELAVAARGHGGVKWQWVRGHDGHAANERCDVIAVSFAQRQPVALFSGALFDYPHLETARVKTIYLSLVDGRVERHGTWKECEARVKGRSAQFKKVASAEEERATLEGWGLFG